MSPSRSPDVPPSPEEGVFSITRSTVINAPREKVWNVLLDFPKYSEWNPFVRAQTIVDRSKKPLPDQTPAAGKYLLMSTHIPPTMGPGSGMQRQSAFEIITHVDNENFRVAWRNIAAPAWILWAERWQTLTDAGEGKTRYQTTEVFGGLAAYIVKWLFGEKLKFSFEEMGRALKERSEQA
ncbi:hypothetical protein GLOTRDRAFT_116062 [Gloeophyllum trabeum ATCC 11539]|uniref:Coenzyme Q-binding protein COQ10 START domain-containing protein n=1 Tax=Gloeophyllum trabeum (strain ATCC 11539 / FP-39264 / Madison 617) TaxID=670483 RepID=S7Q900_GLOTA|nr:uncharacterized protein GLOTRDRAFT_116062 [Gloeophyllum trabeum ATCC 11539]EPQ55908.1 hypothetical protein GLOTRDRAFT_116062 [Gloeophyllum trabeum ATCC 11539]